MMGESCLTQIAQCLINPYDVTVFYITVLKADLLGWTSVPSMLVAGSSHWQQETHPLAALEV